MASRTTPKEQGSQIPEHCVRALMSQYKLQVTDTNPHLLAWMEPGDVRIWYFLAGGLSEPYLGGEYIFKLTAPNEFPHKPPRFEFITPNGVFQPGGPICISIGEWHPDDKPTKDKTAPGAYGWRASLGMMGFATQVVNGMICPDTLEAGIRIMQNVPVEMRASLARVSRTYNRMQYARLHTAFEEIVTSMPNREAVLNITDSRFRLAGKPVPARKPTVTRAESAKSAKRTNDAEGADDAEGAEDGEDGEDGEDAEDAEGAEDAEDAEGAEDADGAEGAEDAKSDAEDAKSGGFDTAEPAGTSHKEQNGTGHPVPTLQQPAPAPQQPTPPQKPAAPLQQLTAPQKPAPALQKPAAQQTYLLSPALQNLMRAHAQKAAASVPAPGAAPAPAVTTPPVPATPPTAAPAAVLVSDAALEATEVMIAFAAYDGHNQEDSTAPAPVLTPAPVVTLPAPAPILPPPAPAPTLSPPAPATIPQSGMPFTESGLAPDIIINTLALAPVAALDADFTALLDGFDDVEIPADDSAELPAPTGAAPAKDDDLSTLIDSLLDE